MVHAKNILVPTDFSHNGSHAIQYACDLAKQSNASLHLVHVVKGKSDQLEKEDSLNRIANSIDADSELSIQTVKRVLFGTPSDAIADYAREHDIDLVVMGTHGRTGLSHVTMGSVAESVLRQAPCPVTVLGPRDGENATITDAMGIVSGMIERGWQASNEYGPIEMAEALEEKLRVPHTTAMLMIDELEYRQWIIWEDGKWVAVEGVELVDNVKPFTVNLKPESQAVELIKRAKSLRATDVHIDPLRDTEFLVRVRIDGLLHDYCWLDHSVGAHLINQYKSMARVDVVDPFRPLEGRVRLPPSLKNTEVRLTSVPVAEGQAAALRILDPQKVFRPLNDLGMTERDLADVNSMLRAGEGIILVTGPTGAGKTTTVYSMLESIGGTRKNIVSIEDPVEFSAPFVRQISVDRKHDLTMGEGLRTLLRMDPDVLFIGEIRDSEAANIAMRAAASGKCVFSTLHTRDVATTITALVDLGLSRSSLAGNLTGIINQRLVKRLCSNCCEALPISDLAKAAFAELDIEEPDLIFEPRGCASCSGRGYRGRVGVFETCVATESVRRAVYEVDRKDELSKELSEAGLRDLRFDALSKVAQGLIAFDEARGIRWLA